ncbi:unnamed protein product, partial [Heterosigma akashiwo]
FFHIISLSDSDSLLLMMMMMMRRGSKLQSSLWIVLGFLIYAGFGLKTQIKVDRNPGTEKLAKLGVFSWPTWSSPIDNFPWEYGDPETCHFLSGE